jgi:hypothetical protein
LNYNKLKEYVKTAAIFCSCFIFIAQKFQSQGGWGLGGEPHGAKPRAQIFPQNTRHSVAPERFGYL